MSKKIVLVLLAVEASVVKEGSGSFRQGGFSVVPSRRVPLRRVRSRRVRSKRAPLRRVRSRRVRSRRVRLSVCDQGGCGQGERGMLPSKRVRVLEAGQRRINVASGPDSVHGHRGRQNSHGCSWFLVCRPTTATSCKVLCTCECACAAAFFWGFVGVGGCALYDGGSESCAMCAMGAGSHAPLAVLCAALYTGGCRRLALSAGGVRGAGGDALCASLCAGGYVLFMELLEVSEVLEVPEMIRYVLLCMLEAVEVGSVCWRRRR